ncbi:MAG TPA: NRDE family protein [Puia sp.]|nr:NRDE family protein [Puia sp.]
MCTVSFIPVNDKVIITSNRDEKHWRSPAIIPQFYKMKTGSVLFPRDADAGGTWFAVHENGNVVIFLNGGFVKHEPDPPYRKSRGVVLLDLIDIESPIDFFQKTDLKNIEPFTAVIFDDEKLFECRWDGEKKYQQRLDAKRSHIWSSVTLYDEEIIHKRKKWFESWALKNPFPSQDDILHFHQFAGDGDKHNDLLMNRNEFVFTVSITSIEMTEQGGIMKYVDVRNGNEHTQRLAFTKAIASR